MTVLPHGSWPSPITAAGVSAASPRIDGARMVGDEVWWGESVPAERGRMTVRRRRLDGAVQTLLPAPWDARSRVHEYGGGSWTASEDGVLFFVEKTDQGVWALAPGGEPRLLTSPDGAHHGGLTLQQGRLLAVRERESAEGVRRDIIELDTVHGGARVLTAGSDFVAHPALSPDGARLAWIAWDHPDMPWDRAQLRVGRLDDGGVAEWTAIAGEHSATVQPVWLGDDELLYSDDVTGRWNLWRAHVTGTAHPRPVAPADADTGGPIWVLGTRWFQALEDGRIVAVRTDGDDDVVLLSASGEATSLALEATGDVSVEHAAGTRVVVTGTGADGAAGVWLVDADHPRVSVRVAGGEPPAPEEWMPQARAVSYDGPHGPVHAYDYPPTNPEATAPEGERAPYVVLVHGGPTAHVSAGASAKIAYLTSRGIGVLDVNYGGSTGYGRAYRERLRGQWGVVDVDDVIAAASGLVAEGRADGARLAISGGSAGGWTVLCALTLSDRFAAGISRYGVADARRLAEESHDFESRYLDGLIGPLPAADELYVERSPLSRLDGLRTPVLLEQGLDDVVVPPSQSEAVRDALARNGVPHAYLTFEGEGHGFRRADTLITALEAELAFLGRILGFETPGVADLPLD